MVEVEEVEEADVIKSDLPVVLSIISSEIGYTRNRMTNAQRAILSGRFYAWESLRDTHISCR